ncbi:MAG: hypothetical protein WCO09_00945 [bacterium]
MSITNKKVQPLFEDVARSQGDYRYLCFESPIHSSAVLRRFKARIAKGGFQFADESQFAEFTRNFRREAHTKLIAALGSTCKDGDGDPCYLYNAFDPSGDGDYTGYQKVKSAGNWPSLTHFLLVRSHPLLDQWRSELRKKGSSAWTTWCEIKKHSTLEEQVKLLEAEFMTTEEPLSALSVKDIIRAGLAWSGNRAIATSRGAKSNS